MKHQKFQNSNKFKVFSYDGDFLCTVNSESEAKRIARSSGYWEECKPKGHFQQKQYNKRTFNFFGD